MAQRGRRQPARGRAGRSRHEHRGPRRHQALRRASPRVDDAVSLDVPTASWSRCSALGSGKTSLLRIIAGLEPPDAGPGAASTARTPPAPRARPPRRLRLPALRAVPAHERLRERGLRPARAAARHAAREAEIREQRDRAAAAGPARLARRPPARPSSRAASASAWRWRAPWRSSPGCCCSTSRSARSTPRCARSCGAGCAGCTTRSSHQRVRHPRPGRGARGGRPRGGDEPGPHRAGRHARRSSSTSRRRRSSCTSWAT